MKALLALLILVVAVSACAAPAPAPVAPAVANSQPSTTGQSSGPARNPAHAQWLPDPKMSPGDVLDVTPKDFCVSGYSSKVRDVPDSVKNQVYAEYGIKTHKPGEYEVDHIISLELGGSNSVKNLWPQPYNGQWNAHIKDKLENTLHSLVCDGKVDYRTAQQAIATDWIAAYQEYVGQ